MFLCTYKEVKVFAKFANVSMMNMLFKSVFVCFISFTTYHVYANEASPSSAKNHLLLAFVSLEPTDTSYRTADLSRTQLVLLKSMQHQFSKTANGNVKFELVDSTELAVSKKADQQQQINFLYDWDLNEMLLHRAPTSQQLIARYKIEKIPTTILIDSHGNVVNKWQGLVAAHELAFALQKALGVTSSGRTKAL